MGGDALGEEVGIEGGTAGQGQDCAIGGIERHDRATWLVLQHLLRRPLQIQIESGLQILAGLRRPIAQDPLDLTHGVHLHHLATPGPAQLRLKGRLQTDATDAIPDLIALLGQALVFLLGNRLGVTEGMGSKRAVRVTAQHIEIHLGAREACALLAKPQHLLRGELAGQLNPITLSAGT